MAITIIQRPQLYTPASNPVIWQMESDNANFLYFRVEVLDHASSAVINTLDIYPSPDYTDGSYVNLSKLLENAVNWQVDNHYSSGNFILPMADPVRAYRVKITEKLLSGNTVTNGAIYNDTSDVCYVWNAKMDQISFDAFDYQHHVVAEGNVADFLTYKPTSGIVTNASTEYLYFLNSSTGTVNVVLEIYNSDGTLDNDFSDTFSDTANTRMYRINVSPRAIKARFGVTLADGQYYTVQLFNAFNISPLSEMRTYRYMATECHLELINLVWANSLGGFDSYQFVNPQERQKTERTSMRLNPWAVISGVYTNIDNNVFNPSSTILDSEATSTVKFYTRVLKDPEVFWLGELVNSKQVFIELSDAKLVPVNLVDTQYNYQRQKYLKGQFNIMDFEVQFATGFIPALSNGKVSYVLNSTYYSRQMSQAFTKDDCTGGDVGSSVIYTVPAGAYTSDLSQADADSKAQDDIDANGQAYANSEGTCSTPPPVGNDVQSGIFYSTLCSGGTPYPEPYTYIVPADTYFAGSKATANAMANADVAANGQDEADANGTCSAGVGNAERTGTFYSTGCAAGSSPDPYVYTVPANTYYSYDLASANALADADIADNGQDAADLANECTLDGAEITITAVGRTEDYGTYIDYYVSMTASAPVTNNITVDVDLNVNGTQTAAPSCNIYAGNTNSNEEFLGSYGPGDPVLIGVLLVTPNPDGSGTVYQF